MWRQYRYVFTADIANMYRQILVDFRDTDYQRIVWQSIPGGPIMNYRFLTITYSRRSVLSPSDLELNSR